MAVLRTDDNTWLAVPRVYKSSSSMLLVVMSVHADHASLLSSLGCPSSSLTIEFHACSSSKPPSFHLPGLDVPHMCPQVTLHVVDLLSLLLVSELLDFVLKAFMLSAPSTMCISGPGIQ